MRKQFENELEDFDRAKSVKSRLNYPFIDQLKIEGTVHQMKKQGQL